MSTPIPMLDLMFFLTENQDNPRHVGAVVPLDAGERVEEGRDQPHVDSPGRADRPADADRPGPGLQGEAADRGGRTVWRSAALVRPGAPAADRASSAPIATTTITAATIHAPTGARAASNPPIGEVPGCGVVAAREVDVDLADQR